MGFGQPAMMRAWLIQALTGRRASEVLLMDFGAGSCGFRALGFTERLVVRDGEQEAARPGI